MRIGTSTISPASAPFIIAEAGINHNGDIHKALAMIETAKAAGANAVKFQTFTAEEFIANPQEQFTYRSQGKDVTESMLAMFKRHEFTFEQWRRIKQKCDRERVLFLSTPQNRSDLELLLKLQVRAVKVGSDDFTNHPLLRRYAATGLPLLLSCGMADQDEVQETLGVVGASEGYPVVLLLCVSEYPTPPEHVNLRRLVTLAQAFPGILLGFSDHTQGVLASSLAVGLGACVFEKHFTLDHDLPGPDHWFSADPEELRRWAVSIRTAHIMMGSGRVEPTAAERDMRLIARRSVVAACDIAAGEHLTAENIALKRPGTGLPPSCYGAVLGRQAKQKLRKGQLLSWEDLV